jgi:hypothetical protein
MSKIMPITSSQSSSHDFDHKRRQQQRKQEKRKDTAVINHIVTEQERRMMKQLALPFDDVIQDVKIFELYLYSKSINRHYRTYGKHVDYTLAETINDAEELFSKTYPSWWKSMGVREVSSDVVKSNLEMLERQVETCKFVLEAFNIVK